LAIFQSGVIWMLKEVGEQNKRSLLHRFKRDRLHWSNKTVIYWQNNYIFSCIFIFRNILTEIIIITETKTSQQPDFNLKIYHCIHWIQKYLILNKIEKYLTAGREFINLTERLLRMLSKYALIFPQRQIILSIYYSFVRSMKSVTFESVQ
jgi:hypothetical protein